MLATLQVSDYLLKPFSFPRFLRAVNKVRNEMGAAAGATTGEKSKNDHLFIRSDRQYRRVDFADIDYLESYGNYVKIWSAGQFVLATRTLSSLTEELPAEDFLKVHKSYVIRKDRVRALEGNQLKLQDGTVVPVGKLQRVAVHAWIKG